MKPSTRLSSAVFQLTPTRTRCELIIVAKEKKEKIASGLINPFLVHLKTAQDQFARGGYSILLQPENGSDVTWFTKATLERFVRFVSTPEILERVYTVETEIFQIEEAILIQSSNDRRHSRHDFGNNTVENPHEKPVGINTGDKSISNCDEKAIVLYTPGPLVPEANGPCHHEEDPKVKLLKVLETRKSMLQKEQGMAFARAVAAGFELDDMDPLVSFAECFGATRLKEACSRFVDLWKSKHETGQWLDIQSSEALSNQSDFPIMNTSGIILSDALSNNGESNLMQGSNGNLGPLNEAGSVAPNSQQEFYQAQFSHLAYPPWPVHAMPDGQPAFQAYPVQGVPFYQPYTSGHFFTPNLHPTEPSASNLSPSTTKTSEISRTVAQYDISSDDPHSLTPQNKVGSSRNKRSGTVVIRNINYISSKRRSSGSETSSDSQSDSNSKDERPEADDSYDRIQSSSGAGGSRKDADDRQWQAFQECLLRKSDEDSFSEKDGIFAAEKEAKIKRQAVPAADDALTQVTRDSGGIRNGRDISSYNEGTSCRPIGSSDEDLIRSLDYELLDRNDEKNVQFLEANGRRVLRGTTHEDFMIDGQRNQEDFRHSYDPQYADYSYGAANKEDRPGSSEVPDELLVPFRLQSLSPYDGTNRAVVDVYSEIPGKSLKMGTEKQENKVNYEPNDLGLMPERGIQNRSLEYNPALDYEMQVCAEGPVGKLNNDVSRSEKSRKPKANSDLSHKQRAGGPIRKDKNMKVSLHEDARARAERLRSYKADLQRMKKEKEEAEKKRLEALRLERQKRISARGNSSSAKPSPLLPQVKQLPSKLSPASSRGSKFSDLEPQSSSPLQRSKIRTSLRYSEPNKVMKSSKLSDSSHTSGNRLARSSSSLPEPKGEVDNITPDSKASLSWIRRLSEPKIVSNPPSTATKARSAETAFTRKLVKGPDKSKVSAIINLDKSKGESLPELKIKGSRFPVNTHDQPSSTKEIGNARESANNCSELQKLDADGNHVVEKIVVVHEDQNPFPASSMSRRPVSFDEQRTYCVKNESSLIPEPVQEVSPLVPNLQQDIQSIARIIIPENSVKGPAIHQPNNEKANKERSETVPRADESAKELPSCYMEDKVDHHKGTDEKASVKDSSKGFRRLLKFGKKHHVSSTADQSVDSESTGEANDAKKTVSPPEAHTLKNLISEDDYSAAASAPRKASRNFSLLSPFRSKLKGKKQME